MKRINYSAARLVSISAYALLVFVFCAIMIGQLEKNIKSSGHTLTSAKENSQLLGGIYQEHSELMGKFPISGTLAKQSTALRDADIISRSILSSLKALDSKNDKNTRLKEVDLLIRSYHSVRSLGWALQEEYKEGIFTEEGEEIKSAISYHMQKIMDDIIKIMKVSNSILIEANIESNSLFVALKSYMVNFCIVIGVILIASAIYLNRLLRQPVQALAKAADEIRSGNLEYTLDVRDIPRDELGMLMRNFNVMARRLSHTASRLEEANKSLKQEADVLAYDAEQRTRFIRHLGHELRAPLSSIIGFTELLMEGYYGDLTKKQEDYLGRINKSGNHLLALVNDLVDQAKMQAGTLKLNYEEFKLVLFVKEIINAFERQADKEGIVLTFEQGDIDDEQMASFDGKRIRQAIINLVSNALKFTPDGESVTAFVTVKDKMVVFEVRDTGIGIKEDEIDEIFMEFHQGDTVKSSEGAGLGLPLSRQLVIMHHGDITVKSQLGEGACFTMILPLKKPAEEPTIINIAEI
jgi:signal transduction histidine kinase